MYKCRNCGNEEKFYGIVKEQGNALIFQNVKSTVEPVPERSLAAVAEGKPPSLHKEPQNTVRCNLWAIQNNGRDDGLTWAYMTSEGSWKGFHEVRSCAVCHSTDIYFI